MRWIDPPGVSQVRSGEAVCSGLARRSAWRHLSRTYLRLVGCARGVEVSFIDWLLCRHQTQRLAIGGGRPVNGKLLKICFNLRGSSRVSSRGGLRARRRQYTAHWSRYWLWGGRLAIVGEVIELSIVVELIVVVEVSELLEVELVAHDGADATEAAHKLIAL